MRLLVSKQPYHQTPPCPPSPRSFQKKPEWIHKRLIKTFTIRGSSFMPPACFAALGYHPINRSMSNITMRNGALPRAIRVTFLK